MIRIFAAFLLSFPIAAIADWSFVAQEDAFDEEKSKFIAYAFSEETGGNPLEVRCSGDYFFVRAEIATHVPSYLPPSLKYRYKIGDSAIVESTGMTTMNGFLVIGKDDRDALVQSLKNGSVLSIEIHDDRLVSKKRYTYSLRGSSANINKVEAACKD